MNSVSTVANQTPIELWRLIRKDWYYFEDEEIFLSNDCLDLRKDMQPPETCISFNEGKGTEYYGKIFQVMEDLFFKLSIKEECLFAGLIDDEIYKSINKREKLIEFKRDRGEEDSHFGLYYLTDDDTKILTVKAKLISFLEKKLTSIIGEDETLKNHLNNLKSRKKTIDKEVKRLKITVVNQIKESCQKCGITDIQIEINKEGNITLKNDNLNNESYLEINEHFEKISPLTLTESDLLPQDINIVLSKIKVIKVHNNPN